MPQERLNLRIIEDHQTLDRVFASLQATLRLMDEQGSGEDSDLLDDVREDLRFALEEMLEHFSIEEEAIFSFLKEALPDLAAPIADLEEGHEILCRKTSRLRQMVVTAQADGSQLDLPQARTLVDEVTGILTEHNQRETQIFIDALNRLDEVGRQRLLEALNSH